MPDGLPRMRARDVDDILRAHGTEKGVVICIKRLAEFQSVVVQQFGELAQAVDQIISVQQDLVTVAERHAELGERLKAMMGHDEGGTSGQH